MHYLRNILTVPAFFRRSFVALALLLTLCVAQKVQATPSVVAVVPSYYTARPGQLAINPNTDKIYFCVNGVGSSAVNVLNATTYEFITSITVGSLPSGIAINAATNKIYVVNSQDSTVSVINGVTDIVTKTIVLGGDQTYGPNALRSVLVNSVTNTIYVPALYYGIVVIDGSIDTISKLIPDVSGDAAINRPLA